MNPSATAVSRYSLKRFRLPKSVITWFITRRSSRSTILWALGFGVYVASKAIGFVDVYPTAAARQKIAETFSSNVGIELLLGKAPQAATTGAYTVWNTLGIMVVIGSIWIFLLATKYFRGEEDSGRQELFLAGQTTARKVTINIF